MLKGEPWDPKNTCSWDKLQALLQEAKHLETGVGERRKARYRRQKISALTIVEFSMSVPRLSERSVRGNFQVSFPLQPSEFPRFFPVSHFSHEGYQRVLFLTLTFVAEQKIGFHAAFFQNFLLKCSAFYAFENGKLPRIVVFEMTGLWSFLTGKQRAQLSIIRKVQETTHKLYWVLKVKPENKQDENQNY